MSPTLKTSVVYIGFGSNQGDSKALFQSALEALSRHIDAIRASALYESLAVGPGFQPNYLNAAIEGTTSLAPEDLLDILQTIEKEYGRLRLVRWGPRTIDLDLLLYGDEVIQTQRLTVPHPQIAHRNFVLAPLIDLQAKLALPNGVSIASLLEHIGNGGLTRLRSSTWKA